MKFICSILTTIFSILFISLSANASNTIDHETIRRMVSSIPGKLLEYDVAFLHTHQNTQSQLKRFLPKSGKLLDILTALFLDEDIKLTTEQIIEKEEKARVLFFSSCIPKAQVFRCRANFYSSCLLMLEKAEDNVEELREVVAIMISKTMMYDASRQDLLDGLPELPKENLTELCKIFKRHCCEMIRKSSTTAFNLYAKGFVDEMSSSKRFLYHSEIFSIITEMMVHLNGQECNLNWDFINAQRAKSALFLAKTYVRLAEFCEDDLVKSSIHYYCYAAETLHYAGKDSLAYFCLETKATALLKRLPKRSDQVYGEVQIENSRSKVLEDQYPQRIPGVYPRRHFLAKAPDVKKLGQIFRVLSYKSIIDPNHQGNKPLEFLTAARRLEVDRKRQFTKGS